MLHRGYQRCWQPPSVKDKRSALFVPHRGMLGLERANCTRPIDLSGVNHPARRSTFALALRTPCSSLL
jgi:hypothetical protein